MVKYIFKKKDLHSKSYKNKRDCDLRSKWIKNQGDEDLYKRVYKSQDVKYQVFIFEKEDLRIEVV